MADVDAIVIGSGPNGLAAANLLADEGWSVLVLEASATFGGAVQSAELMRPGFIHDRFSAFYPLAAASPVLRSLRLEEWGLRWAHAPAVLAHPFRDGRAAVLSRDLDATAASVEVFAAGDGDAWRHLYDQWLRVGDSVVASLLHPFPPLRAGARLARAVGLGDMLEFARFTLLPVRQMTRERFGGEGATQLLAGNTLHTDLGPGDVLGGFFGWMLASLAQQVGFPVPEGGAGNLTAAMVRRLEAGGGVVRGEASVDRIIVRGGRAVGVELASGETIGAGRAVIADVGAPALYLRLVGTDHLPAHLIGDLERFAYDHATVKVDWALSAPVPWTASGVAGAGTVHVGGTLDDLARTSYQLTVGEVPEDPFLVVGQMTTADPTRSPAGTETAWAYTHVPQEIRADGAGRIKGTWDTSDIEAITERIEAQMERFAPGFGDRILDRHVVTPRSLEAEDANLVGGAVNGGSAQLFQQLVFRPVPGRGRAETPIKALYLGSASVHPGGGVHGACGANAARAALWHDRGARVMAAARTITRRR